MSQVLTSLKLVNAKRQNSIDPIIFRRNKLNEKLKVQIAMAQALNKGEKFTVKRMRNVRDDVTGLTSVVEVSKRVKTWWFTNNDTKKVAVQIFYGNKVIDLAKGKNAVEVANGDELIAYAKKAASEGKSLTYASVGPGSLYHLLGEHMSSVTGIAMTHVPYKGQPDALNDLFAGRVSMMPLTVALANTHVKAGKLRALAVTTAKRSSAMPQLPTVAESANLPAYEVGTWFGLVAPAKVPSPIIQKMAKDITEFLAMPDVKTRLNTLGMELAPQDPAEFDAFVAKELEKWSQVIKKAGIESQ